MSPDPVVPAPSPSGSMAGYSFLEWLRRNKGDLKLLISAASGLGSAWISQHLVGDWAAFVGTAAGILTKMILDGLDYWLTANPGQ